MSLQKTYTMLHQRFVVTQHIHLTGKASAQTVVCKFTKEWHCGCTDRFTARRLLYMNIEEHGVKARRDDSVPFCIYYVAFSRFKVRLQRSSQYDFFPSFFSLNLTSSKLFKGLLMHSGASVSAPLQVMLQVLESYRLCCIMFLQSLHVKNVHLITVIFNEVTQIPKNSFFL